MAGADRHDNDETSGPRGAAGAVHLLEFDPPFDVIAPENLTSPLVISSPHSGSVYPQSFLEHSRLDALTLRRSEDAYVDQLFAGSVKAGVPLLFANFPRAYLDVNREPYELDPRMFDGRLPSQANTRSIRVAGGLGTIARIVSESQEIYKGRLPIGEIQRRVDGLYEPYHQALRHLLERSWQMFGAAVLLDCHSMPSQQGSGLFRQGENARADVILGDRYGTSCDPKLVAVLEGALNRRGMAVGRNKPYAGGFITENYGSPALGTHAIQIEINRGLYMNEATLEKRPDFQALAGLLADAVAELAAYIDNAFRREISAAAE